MSEDSDGALGERGTRGTPKSPCTVSSLPDRRQVAVPFCLTSFTRLEKHSRLGYVMVRCPLMRHRSLPLPW